MPTHKQGKKCRKYERNKVKCSIYKDEGRREKNKARRLKKYLKHRFNWLKNRMIKKVITEKQTLELNKLKLKFE